MTDNQLNFLRFGCHHIACGRVLKGHRHTAGLREASLEDHAMDHPPEGIQPVRHVIEGARSFAASKGLDDPHAGIDYHKVMTNRGLLSDLAKHYDRLPNDDRSAHKHFDAMHAEVDQQFHHMTHTMGIKMHVTDHDPYKDVHELRHDVEHNHQIKVLGTHATGGHPYFSNETNDRFRAVHDLFGHLGTGRDFDRHGEEAAFQAHARMFSEHARPALTSETRGQNGSLIVNGSFGPQKIAVLPRKLWHPGLASSATHIDDYRAERSAQDARYEGHTGLPVGETHRQEYRDYFGTGDYAGHPQENRLTYKDHLRGQKAQQEEHGSVREREYWAGHEMGAQHADFPSHNDEAERGHAHAHSEHPAAFAEGYQVAHSQPAYRVASVNQLTSGQPASNETGRNEPVIQRMAVLIGFVNPENHELMVNEGFRTVAHVSGNSIDIMHCPFCGSGAVIARSDGTVECNFCTSVFTVQVQPQFAAFPQTAEGMPYEWPGQPGPGQVVGPGAPGGAMGGFPGPVAGEEDPDAEDGGNPFAGDESGDEEEGAGDDAGGPDGADDDADAGGGKAQVGGKDKPPFGKKSRRDPPWYPGKPEYRTASGHLLSQEDYVRHLALSVAKNRGKVARLVRDSR